MELSYLSLQPPPGRILDDTIQFETLDIYLWTGSDFDAPSLLFYAGPVYDEETDNINDQGGEPSNEVIEFCYVILIFIRAIADKCCY